MSTAAARSNSTATPRDLAFAREMLPAVSRTFAPAIDILPQALADPVRLAYLLCRVADTIEDATRIPASVRRASLLRYGSLLSAADSNEHDAEAFAEKISHTLDRETPEVRLVAGLPRLLRLLHRTDDARRECIAQWTCELALGMARVVSLEDGQPHGWTALATCDDLTTYEYYVAGTVGCMLNDLIHHHITGDGKHPSKRRCSLAVSFGLGLQGTNIIQDLSADRARGWSYLPEEIAARYGTATRRLHEARERPAAMMAIREMAWRAINDLDNGFEYVLLLPRRHPRIRLFCLWPLLLAVRTLTRLLSSPDVLLQRVRITRSEVRELTRGTMWRCLSNAALKRLYLRERMGFATVSGMDGTPAGSPVIGQKKEG